jgi:hypothetical protein
MKGEPLSIVYKKEEVKVEVDVNVKTNTHY